MEEQENFVEIHLLGEKQHKQLINDLKRSSFKDNKAFWIDAYSIMKNIDVEEKKVILKLSTANYSEEKWEKNSIFAIIFIGDTTSLDEIKKIYNNNQKYCSNAIKYIRVYNKEDFIDEENLKKFEAFSKKINAQFEIDDKLISDKFLIDIIKDVLIRKEIENEEKEKSCCIIS